MISRFFGYDLTQAEKDERAFRKQLKNIGVLPRESRKKILGVYKNNSTQTTLDLTWDSIGAEGAKAIATALQSNSTLTTLDLYYTSIGDEGAKAIATALQSNRQS